MTTHLFNHSDLARHFGLDSSTVGKLLDEAGIKPAQTLKAGRGMARYYPMNDAEPTLRAYVEQRAAKRATRTRGETEATVLEQPKYLAEVLNHLKTLDEKLTRVLDQNAIIFRTLAALAARQEGASAQESAHNSELAEALDACLTQPADAPHAPTTAGNKRPKVFILGLLPGQVTMIAEEFKDALDLRFAQSGNPQRVAKMSSFADAAIVMGSFTDHATMNAVKNSGCKKFIQLQGGLTRLRDELTRLYVEQA